tara:strand:+ start:905 stop:1777 length:873 start_codon:yes stop_codon:yes gene_type:complete
MKTTDNQRQSVRVLSFGGGVDSSAILHYHLNYVDLDIDQVVFADTGAESKATYANVQRFKALCDEVGLPFQIVAKDGETITDWVTRLGIVPVMAGASHVCSKKYKGDVIQAWVCEAFPAAKITYLIGIEANEGKRTAAFTKPKGDNADYEYPLQDMGMTRQDCIDLLDTDNIEVAKSSCVFCPFMSHDEIRDLRNDPEAWQTIKLVERRFSEESPRKHQAWLDAGKPFSWTRSEVKTDKKTGAQFTPIGMRAPKGMWRRDAWADGTRLFIRKQDGKQLSVAEWEAQIDAA